MSQPEYAGAPRVFVIVDNGSDHRGRAAIDRLRKAHPNAIMIHTPVHASWLNQAEIFFSIIQKKVVTPNDFASTTELSRTLLAFLDRYNLTARPFNWKFTADDLTALLGRISEREQKPPTHPPASRSSPRRLTTPDQLPELPTKPSHIYRCATTTGRCRTAAGRRFSGSSGKVGH